MLFSPHFCVVGLWWFVVISWLVVVGLRVQQT
jgi:hypothetical protein